MNHKYFLLNKVILLSKEHFRQEGIITGLVTLQTTQGISYHYLVEVNNTSIMLPEHQIRLPSIKKCNSDFKHRNTQT
jgi:hypothetical protein